MKIKLPLLNDDKKWGMGFLLLSLLFLNSSFNPSKSQEGQLKLSSLAHSSETTPDSKEKTKKENNKVKNKENPDEQEIVGPPSPPKAQEQQEQKDEKVKKEEGTSTEKASQPTTEGEEPGSQDMTALSEPSSDEDNQRIALRSTKRMKNPIQTCSLLNKLNDNQFPISIDGREIGKGYIGTLNFKAEIRNVKTRLSDGSIERRPIVYVCQFNQDSKKPVEIESGEVTVQGSFCDCTPKAFTLNKSIEDLSKAFTEVDKNSIKEKLITALKKTDNEEEEDDDDDDDSLTAELGTDEDDKEEQKKSKLAKVLAKQLRLHTKVCERKVDETTKIDCLTKKLVKFYKVISQKFDHQTVPLEVTQKFYEEEISPELTAQIKLLNRSSKDLVKTLLAAFPKRKDTKEFHDRILQDSHEALEQGLIETKQTLDEQFTTMNANLEKYYESDPFAKLQYQKLRTNPLSVLNPEVQNLQLWYDGLSNGISTGLKNSGMSPGEITQDYNSVFSSLNPIFKTLVQNPYTDINNKTYMRPDLQIQLSSTNPMNLLTINPANFQSTNTNSPLSNSYVLMNQGTPPTNWSTVAPSMTSQQSFFGPQNGFQSLGPSGVPPFDPIQPYSVIGKSRTPGTGI